MAKKRRKSLVGNLDSVGNKLEKNLDKLGKQIDKNTTKTIDRFSKV